MRPLAAAHDWELPAHVCKHFVQLRRLSGDVALSREREFQQGRGDGAQKLRCRAALLVPVTPAGLPARTRHPSRLARHPPAGDGPGRQAPHRQHSIRGSCLDSSVCAHGATARPPGRCAAHRCAPVLTRHSCRPRTRRWPHPLAALPLPRSCN